MTKKNYVAIANVLAEFHKYDTDSINRSLILAIATSLGYEFQKSDSKFNINRFVEIVKSAELI